ncbi:hypothetical protein [Piscinibacter sakaiensis]|uniref:hypothetical protein n=1 Tax=Piscinibacter sakaiensis TaxID=1547922 RepID=UPI003AB0FDB9
MNQATSSLTTALAGAVLAVCTAVAFAADAPKAAAPAAQEAGPPPECTAALDELSQGIPQAETGPHLRRMGLKIRTPIIVPNGLLTERNIVSGARVRVMIDKTGQVVPGSVTVQRSTGDPKLPIVLTEAVPATLSFDVSGAFTVPDKFPFTTVYVVCASSS